MSTANNTLNILGDEIKPGESKEVDFDVAHLHTASAVNVPIIIERSKTPGPTVLFTAGVHGDEVNGVEIVRQLIAKGINKPKSGTIICIPIINIFGFLNLKREFPDGRDLNRVFPGSKNGSLASRVAHKLMTEIIPHVDYIIDFHTGGSGRFNAPQIRIEKSDSQLNTLARVFGAPFILHSKYIKKSFRSSCNKLGKPLLLFEGGKSIHIDEVITNHGVVGSKRVLDHLGMLNSKFVVFAPKTDCVMIAESKWIRAKYSGMFKVAVNIGSKALKGDLLGYITDPYGKMNYFVKADISGYVITINESPTVYQGDALFNISTKLEA